METDRPSPGPPPITERDFCTARGADRALVRAVNGGHAVRITSSGVLVPEEGIPLAYLVPAGEYAELRSRPGAR